MKHEKLKKPALREETEGKVANRGMADSSVGQPGMAAPPLGTSRRATALAGGLLVLAAIAAYSNSFGGALTFDDERWILQNPAIRQLWPIPSWLLPHDARVRGRPVISFTLAVNYALGKTNVWGYHALNLAIHILASLVLFGIVRRTLVSLRTAEGDSPIFAASCRKRMAEGDSPIFAASCRKNWDSPLAATPLALAVALLWTVHPLQTQAVTYVIQRCESLASLFYLLTLYCVIRGAELKKGTVPFLRPPITKIGTVPWLWNAAAVAACLLGAGTKEIIVTCPMLVLLYDRTFLSGSFRGALRARSGLYLGLAASWAAVLGLLISNGFYGGSAGFAVKTFTWWSYLLTQSGVLVHYLRLAFWPTGLCLDYGWPPATTLAAIVPPSLVIVGLLGLSGWALVKRPAAGFVGAWFFLILAPSSSFIPVRDAAFEQRMYLPLAAVATAMVIGGYLAGRRLIARGLVSRRAAQRAGVCLVAFVGIVLAVLTFHRNTAYSTTVSIWEDAIAKAPDNARAYANLGHALLGQSRFNEAILASCKALQLDPNLDYAYSNLGGILCKLNRFREGIPPLQKALQLNPDCVDAHCNLGAALANCGKLSEAAAQYEQALRLQPDQAEAHFNYGNLLAQQAKFGQAIRHYRKALDLDPAHVAAHNNLAAALRDCGRFDEAIFQCQQALRLQPALATARNVLHTAQLQKEELRERLARQRGLLASHPNDRRLLQEMAWTLATNPNASIRNGSEAVALAKRAVELSAGRDPVCFDTLAAAYAEAGQFPDAVRSARQAVDLARRQAKPGMAEAVQARLRLYETRTPFRHKQPVGGTLTHRQAR